MNPTTDPTYEFCSGDDPDRTEFWCVHEHKWKPKERHFGCDVCTTWRKLSEAERSWAEFSGGRPIKDARDRVAKARYIAGFKDGESQ